MKQTNTKTIKLFGKVLILIILFTILSGVVSALCNFESLRYYGTCPFDGDIKVYDQQNTLIVEQLFSVDQGCYEGRYSMQVPGGREVDCVLNNGENIRFELNGNIVGYDVWNGEGIKEFDLTRDPKMPGEKSDAYFWVTIIAVIIIILAIFVWYIKKINR